MERIILDLISKNEQSKNVVVQYYVKGKIDLKTALETLYYSKRVKGVMNND